MKPPWWSPKRWAVAFICLVMAACQASAPLPTPSPPPLAESLVLYNWADYMPTSVLEAFTAEYGVQITYLTYDTMDEALQSIEAGQAFDVAVIEHELIPQLVAAGRVAKLDHGHLPNLKNVSPGFRDLTFDPGDTYSVPYSWGTTGLLVRTDRVTTPITRWADVWDTAALGLIAVRPDSVELISLTLKALGYPLNSEDPQHLEAALDHLLLLKPSLIFVLSDESAVDTLLSGQAIMLLGWPGDALYAAEQSSTIQYILPEEGSMLWGDRFVISAESSHQYTAEVFLDFLLRPEVAGQIVNENHYAIANDAARPFIDPAILNNPILYPSSQMVEKAEWYLPLSPAGEKLYADIWQRFLAAAP